MDHNDKTPLVSIICLTYNHGAYIRECLNGFLMQETDFSFEVIVHDDASTDNTPEIIREYTEKYPTIIKPIFQTENQYSKYRQFFSILKICINLAKGRFIAFCDGDDYWIDKLKLKSQVNILDRDTSLSMCCTDCNKISKNGALQYHQHTQKNIIKLEDELYSSNKISTLTVLCRKKYIKDFPYNKISEYKIPLADLSLWIWLLTKGNCYRINKATANYRILDNSASHYEDPEKQFKFSLMSFGIREKMCNILGIKMKKIYKIKKYIHIIKSLKKNPLNRIKYIIKNN